YQRYWEDLFVTAVKVTHSPEDARDIVQEIFLSLWNRRNELGIAGSMEGYLQTCVRYKAIDYIEKNITRRRYLEALLETVETNLVPDAETQLKLKELQQAVSSAVSQMPVRMRQVYQLSRQEQLSHKEIASLLGISDETVKKHIHHALQHIRSAIDHTTIPYAVLLIAFFL
ncbi:MAG: RNA polymerase sigma-70 factor, partial [Flavitalea sp.]